MPIPIVTLMGKAVADTIDLVTLRGTGVAGVVNGLGGDDTLRGGGYADTIIGGGGNDVLDARAGADEIRGGDGDDRLILRPAMPGRDTIDGGEGNDILVLRLTEAQAADGAIAAEIAAVRAALDASPGVRVVALGATFNNIEGLRVEIVPNVRAIDLDRIDFGHRGFRIVGENPGDHAGATLAALGDINGDGLADLLIGAPGSDAAGPDSGAAYVVFGTAQARPIDLGTIAAGQGGFRIDGRSAEDLAGRAIAALGDVDGDGIGDFVIGAPADNDSGRLDVGAAYVVFGGPGMGLDLVDIGRGQGGFRIVGTEAGDFAGYAVGAAGDVNGDGLADLLVAAPNDARQGPQQGAVALVFGKADGAEVDLNDVAAGIGGLTITGENPRDQSGIAVAGGGDINGDGYADLLIGAWLHDGPGGKDSGAAYVVWGRPRLDAVDLTDVAAGIGGFKMFGEAARDQAGFSVAIAGDVNGDGLADVLVGARGNDSRINFDSGAAYVVFGKADGTAVALDDVGRRTGGFEITGEARADQAGWAVAAAGDVNGDGLADLLIGAAFNDSGGQFQNGAAYVVYGKTDNERIDLSAVVGGNGGFKIRGEDDADFAGRAIAAAGDVNGDGFADLAVGAANNDAGGEDAGAAYILFGGSTWLG